MHFRAVVPLAAVISMVCALLALAADPPNRPPFQNPGVTRIVAVLPEGWKSDYQDKTIVVRRIDEPVIINIFQADAPKPGQTHESWLLSHKVNIQYRIIVHFAQKIDAKRVAEMREENQAIEAEMKKLRSPPLSLDERDRRYKTLKQSLKKVPNGYLGEWSVYVESTELGYAQFFDANVAKECQAVIDRIKAALTPYVENANNRE